MNIVRKLTLRQMKKNKRRTLITIIGVIISVAMLTAVPTLVSSFMDGMQWQSISETGDWHAKYLDVNQEQIQAIKDDDITENVALSKDMGYAMLDDSDNVQKPYVFFKALNKDSFTTFPTTLTKGHYPENPGEIVISEDVKSDAGMSYDIGDTVEFAIGDRIPLAGEYPDDSLNQGWQLAYDYNTNEAAEKLDIHQTKSFEIVGVMEGPNWEPSWAPGYTVLAFLDEEAIASGDDITASVTWKKVSAGNKEHAGELADKLDIDDMSYNDELLRYYGLFSSSMKMTLIMFSSIIMAIIIIGSVSLIYNAFAISVAERSRYLGMLSSVGATKKQKRQSVFFEGFIIGIISIPLGIIAGVSGIWVTLAAVSPLLQNVALGFNVPLHVTVTPSSIIVACAVSIFTILLSTYIPARRASKITAIDAIRQSQDIKLTNKKVKTSRIVRKLFGFEAEIALKNLKRNKRKYMATVFSLVISIILFLSVSYFTSSLKQTNEMASDMNNYDISIDKPELFIVSY